METHAQGTRIRGFDGLRAIAFVLVFISHKIVFADANSYGGAGVWLFFVLSGFLITRILATTRSEIEAGRTTFRQGLRRFYIRRTGRIFPPYYALLAIVGIVALFVPIDAFWGLNKLAYATYTTNILIAHQGYWPGHFGHLWTLAVEEQFYVLFAPLVLLVSRRHTLSVCAAVIALGIATRIGLEIGGASETAKEVNSFFNFALLAWGGVIGLNAHRKLPLWLTTGAAQLATLAVFIALAVVFGSGQAWRLYGQICVLVAGLLLLQIMQGQGSWLVRALEWWPIRDLGRISYGTYLLHNFIVLAPLLYGIAPDAQVFGMQWAVTAVLEFAVTIAIAALSWRYLEKPIITWARSVTDRAPAAVEGVPSQALETQTR
jgi:peptidoglycan/LPS O-acetylase OafA/YrhL